MALQSVILRPTACLNTSTSYLEFYPSETTLEDSYLLVAEADADDDASYVITSHLMTGHMLLFNIPGNIPWRIVDVKVHCRVKNLSTAVDAYTMAVHISDANKDNITSSGAPIRSSAQEPSGEWYNYAFNFIDELDFIESVNKQEAAHFKLTLFGGTQSGDSKSGQEVTDAYYTQVYIELIYDDSSVLYIRENNTWAALTGPIYRKENDAWVEIDDSIFANGDSFISRSV